MSHFGRLSASSFRSINSSELQASEGYEVDLGGHEMALLIANCKALRSILV